MAKKPKNPSAERAAAAIMREFSPKTADEAQEALRSVFGPMIETHAQGGAVSVNVVFTIDRRPDCLVKRKTLSNRPGERQPCSSEPRIVETFEGSAAA